jgi:predicted Kef-type K+ transport protein
MRVHRRNITTLVGYCYEGTYMGLIYEYMANGDLEQHLSGLGVVEILSKK